MVNFYWHFIGILVAAAIVLVTQKSDSTKINGDPVRERNVNKTATGCGNAINVEN